MARVVAVALAAAPGPARAADPSKAALATARDLFSRAERDEDRGQWAAAVETLRRAGAVKMTPGIRFHIALCEEKMGQLTAALLDYSEAEAAARSEGNGEVLDAIAEPLGALRARVPTLTVTLPAGVAGVEVSLDGVPLPSGVVGTKIPVDVGSHVVDSHAEGFPPFSATVVVSEKDASSVEVRFPPAPLPATSPPPERAPGAATREPPPRVSSGKGAAIAATVGAVALVGLGAGAFVIAGSKQSSGEVQCATLVACDGLKAGVRTWDALALGAWIAGAGVGALSVYLWARPGKGPEKKVTAELRVGAGWLDLAGAF